MAGAAADAGPPGSATPDTGEDAPVPLPNVSSKILAKVIEYCKYHDDAAKTGEDGQPAVKEEEAKAWDAEFVKVDQGTLFELILARAPPAQRARRRAAGAGRAGPGRGRAWGHSPRPPSRPRLTRPPRGRRPTT